MMELDDLKRAWNEELSGSRPESIAATMDQLERLDRRTRTGAAIEISAAALIALTLAAVLTMAGSIHWLSQLGAVVMIGSAVVIGLRLWGATNLPRRDELTVAQRVSAEISKLERWSRLGYSVATWYVAPMFLGVFLAIWGSYVERVGSYLPDRGLGAKLAALLLFGAALVWSSRTETRRRIEPLLGRLRQIREQLVEGS